MSALALAERLEQRSMPEPNSGCVLWTGALTTNGYAQMKIRGRAMTAHRVAFVSTRGPIPEGKILDHLCRVRSCINPRHLDVVTQRENILRGVGASAQASRRVTCIRGHAFEITRPGRRTCEVCHRAQARASYQRRTGRA